ncbi:hypothetical protein [Lentzea sp. NPDC004782]|uniref:hypothetical protein n=1 Tax=Lentzea sp. NPDC004782 TaxID=3154458 RepID=UPI0033A2130B
MNYPQLLTNLGEPLPRRNTDLDHASSRRKIALSEVAASREAARPRARNVRASEGYIDHECIVHPQTAVDHAKARAEQPCRLNADILIVAPTSTFVLHSKDQRVTDCVADGMVR